MKIVITRYYEDGFQTEGNLEIIKPLITDYECKDKTVFSCKTLELPWRDNKRNTSRIPTGTYSAIRHISPNFGKSIWIRGVLNRSEILIHVGNFVGNTNPNTGRSDSIGCVLVGKRLRKVGKHKNLTDSRTTINKIYDLCDDELTVEIIDRFI